ncbi:M17 family metallopeptidase [Alteromonas oceanisediminis]|uniref:M17 family metallopeptidase n=1 Tax=Alteromonas oceanisediminis TaxID=2836180 RepID=UPI001BDB1717|nr:leucyl aminopeptidase family protein [Alteromonas oceanisediminis]MBT0585900.1 leucyl aminopeptidase family protein [Alteromonas oceanisediminis]
MPAPKAIAISSLNDPQTFSQFDAAVVISDTLDSQQLGGVAPALEAQKRIDARVGKEICLLAHNELPGGRLLHVPTGRLDRYYDDVRRIFDVAHQAAGVMREAGIEKPLLMVSLKVTDAKYAKALEAAFLGMTQALWQPLEARESKGENTVEPIEYIGIVGLNDAQCGYLNAVEAGKRVARDLCGTEPERMAPPAFAQYCQQAFAGSAVSVAVIDDDTTLRQDYPLLHAVARASVKVERHQPRVVRLTYTGSGPITKSLFLAGKGITFDTGGADLKVNGHMAGMSRDKGGAAAVAGLMRTLADTQPKGLHVVAELGVVRNSIGSDAFVPDEIIQGHAGKRVRVGNTDAEGRMVLADVLSHLRELALDAAPDTQSEIFTMATLTGHAAIAFGPYTGYVQNGVAEQANIAEQLVAAGALWGDMGEPSLSRREDYDFIRARTHADDVLSSNNGPSATTPRGHQFPMAFLAIASGLDEHDLGSESPLAFTHVDIAGSGVEKGDWQHGKPTAAPVTAFSAMYAMLDSVASAAAS